MKQKNVQNINSMQKKKFKEKVKKKKRCKQKIRIKNFWNKIKRKNGKGKTWETKFWKKK